MAEYSVEISQSLHKVLTATTPLPAGFGKRLLLCLGVKVAERAFFEVCAEFFEGHLMLVRLMDVIKRWEDLGYETR